MRATNHQTNKGWVVPHLIELRGWLSHKSFELRKKDVQHE